MRPVVERERDATRPSAARPNAERSRGRRDERRESGRAPNRARTGKGRRAERGRTHEFIVAPMTTEVALGALAAAGAAACYETSYALQALEARRVRASETVDVSLFARLARRPLWLGPIAVAAAGWPLHLLALSLAPLTLVQPVIALGVVLLLVLAAWILHERIGRRELIACAGIVLGVAGIAWAAPERSSSHAGTAALAVALGLLGAFVVVPYVAPVLGRRSVPALWLVVSAGARDP